MPEQNGKATFDSEARKQGGSLVTTIPKKIVEEHDIQEGDEINWQLEHSEKIAQREDRENGDYASFWNETVQSGERKTSEDQ